MSIFPLISLQAKAPAKRYTQEFFDFLGWIYWFGFEYLIGYGMMYEDQERKKKKEKKSWTNGYTHSK